MPQESPAPTDSTVRLAVTLFGTPTIRAPGQSGTVMLPRRARDLLLALLLSENGSCSAPALTALLWPELSAVGAGARQQQAIADINRLLMPLLNGRPAVRQDEYGVHVDTAAFLVDLLELEACLADTEQHPHRSLLRCDQCLTCLETELTALPAAALFVHDRHSSASFGSWMMQRSRVLQRRLQPAFQTLFTRSMLLQQQAQAAALAALWQLHCPADEAALRARMLTVALTERRPQALTLFRRAQRFWQEELHGRLDPATVLLAEQIRRNALPAVSPTPLPPIRPLIGRADELAAAEHLLLHEGCRLLNIVGIPGVGKSSLAHQLAAQLLPRFADGVCLVAAGSVSSADALLRAIAAALNLQATPQQPLIDQIGTWLSTRDQLLVLDAVEQVAGIEQLLHDLISRTRSPQFLITSRRRLHLQYEAVITLEPWQLPAADADLPAEPAAQLLLAYAGRNAAAELPALHRLLELCAGLPLALELVARLAAEHPLQVVVDQLTGSDNAPAVDPTTALLRSTWQHLPLHDRQLLQVLGSFVGPFTITLLQSVAAPLADAAHISSVCRYALDHALLQLDAAGRYDLHPLLRRVLHDELTAQPQLAATIRHARALTYLQLLDREGPTVTNSTTIDWSRRHAFLADDLLTAWQDALALQFDPFLISATPRIAEFFSLCGRALDFDTLLQQHIEHLTDPSRSALRRRLLGVRVQLLRYHNRKALVQPVLDELIAAIDGQPDVEQTLALRTQAGFFAERGDFSTAFALLERSRDGKSDGSPLLVSNIDGLLGRWYLRLGRSEEALPLLLKALAEARRVGSQRNELSYLNELALIPLIRGDPSAAIPPFNDAVRLARTLGDAVALSTLLNNLANAHEEAEDSLDQILLILDEASAVAQRSGTLHEERLVLANRARILLKRGRLHPAYRALRESLLRDCRLGYTHLSAEVLLRYIEVLVHFGRRKHLAELAAAVSSLPPGPDITFPARRDALLAGLPAFSALSAPIERSTLSALITADDDLLTQNPA